MSEKEPRDEGTPIRSFLGEIGRFLAQGARESILWTLLGGTVGALVAGAAGARYFGWTGLGVGLLAGAVAGIMVVWWLYASI